MKKTLQTRLLHSEYRAPENFTACLEPIHKASTIIFKDVASMRQRNWYSKEGYTYGLHGTPTTFTLEAALCEIEEGEHCLLVPSGLAAITMVFLALLKQGDDCLVADNVYGPTRDWVNWMQERYGVSVRFYNPLISAEIKELIQANTRLIWLESPGSITFEVADVAAICKLAKQQKIPVALDNTYSAGIAFKAFEKGVDIIVQALTKYQAGHGDLLMGAVIVKDEALYRTINRAHMLLGMGVNAEDAYLILRNLPNMAMRYSEQDKSARIIARWLKEQVQIEYILHPAFTDCPGHQFWQRDFSAAASLFSVVFKKQYTQNTIDQFLERLQLFKLGFSWGGMHSLCIPYAIENTRQHWPEEWKDKSIVRFYVGMEDSQDLIQDLQVALSTL